MTTASVVAARVLTGRYADSVLLMRLAQQLTREPGIEDAAAMMATDANKRVLVDGGFDSGALVDARANDLVVAVKGTDASSASAALDHVDAVLSAVVTPASTPVVRRLEDAIAVQPTSNLAVISLPGEYAAAEARKALELGLHTFIFSSNVSVEDEVTLKRLAGERGLLCMGPDCGTALIAGIGIGFANAVQKGPVGVVGASGTGIQAVTSMLDRFGVGITHAIGAGSRDMSDAVGGLTTLAGLRVLDADPATELVVVIGKPPGPTTLERLHAAVAHCTTPVLCCFLGQPGEGPATLEDTARLAAAAVGATPPADPPLDPLLAELQGGRTPRRRYVRGLYAGGTLGYEAQLVLASAGLTVRSNEPLHPDLGLADVAHSEAHTVIDLGGEEFTRGRPHPMIDPRTRRTRLVAEAADPDVAVVLLDIVLGYGAADNPAGDLAGAITTARAEAAGQRGSPAVVASVCGTNGDPQGLARQEATLREAGAVVLPTNAQAAQLAARLVSAARS